MATTMTGVVSSAKANKTITVTVTSRETHPIYGKQYTVTRKYTAHDELNEPGECDKVINKENRKISQTKKFTLVEVVEKARGSVELKEEA